MKRVLIILLQAALCISLHGTASAAGQGILLTEELQMKLGDSFMAEREFYRAVTEYQKFLFLFPRSGDAAAAQFKIGMAYYQGDEFDAAARAFTTVLENYPESSHAPPAGYRLGLCHWRENRLDEAAAALAAVAARYPSSEEAPRARRAAALVAFDRKDPTASRRELERFLADYPHDPGAGRAREALTILEQQQELPRKSPLVAGLLSALLPGAGHLYAGHPGDGITSFFLNGLFIAGTVVAVRQENYPVAGVVGVIGIPFYLGNIYGAANAAAKWNIGVRKELRGTLAVTLDSPF